MLDINYINKMLESEWVEDINPDDMPERYIEEKYRLKEGTPEEFKKEWEEFCELFRLHG